MSNAVVHWQIVAKDPDRVASFYRQLFGWTITNTNALGYREVKAEAGGIAGGIWPSPPEGHNFVQLFVSVDDLDRAAASAVGLGATMLVPPSGLPDGAAMAVLLDPVGIPFCMTQPAAPPG